MNLNSHRSPCCDSDEQRSTVNNTSNEYNQIDHDLMAKVLSNHNISAAWQHVKRNKGAAGIDNMSIEEFNDFAKLHWLGIKQQLLNGSYQPLPVKRVMGNDSNLLIVFYVQIMPDDFVMQLHRF
ncbi:hypothetical protein K8Q40_26205 [Klebsiella pneumoniae]